MHCQLLWPQPADTLWSRWPAVGLGLFVAIPTLAVQNAIPRTRMGAGASAMRYMRQAGNTLGVAIVSALVVLVALFFMDAPLERGFREEQAAAPAATPEATRV